MSEKYILEGKTAVRCDDLMSWANWFEKSERSVAITKIGATKISTVFLGLDHSFGRGQPLLFETMVFGGPMDQHLERYSTWEEAESGHASIVEKVKALDSPVAACHRSGC